MRILATPDISPLFVRYLFDGSFNFCASICIQKLLSQQIDPRKAKHASMSLLLCPLICSTSAFPFHPAPGMFSAPQQILLAAADEAITPSQMQFYIFMLFGAGPFAPGFAALSQSRKDFDAFGTLSGGPTLGGPSINLTPLQAAVLPELLRVADVNQCIQVCPAASNLPTPKLVNPQATSSGSPSQLSQYVSKSAFTSKLVDKFGCNPLAFECLLDVPVRTHGLGRRQAGGLPEPFGSAGSLPNRFGES
jgi:hypothetical protein